MIALLDSGTGSSINVMAKNTLDHSVDVWGTARVEICQSPSSQPTLILVHILHSATHPLILGTDYLKFNKIFFVTFQSCEENNQNKV